MQYPQTAYSDTLQTGISSTALSLTVTTTAPTRTEGILTVGRSQGNREDVYFNNVVGNVVTINLRGLSTTALTLTEVAGNKKVHAASESLEITTHHNYDTNKARLDEANTFTNTNTFSGNNNAFTGTGNRFTNAPRTPGLVDTNGNEALDTPATTNAVNQLKTVNAVTTVPAFLTGGNTATSVVATWTAVNNGSFAITIDGVARTVSNIDFTTGVTTMADVATKIQTAVRALTLSTETVVWTTDHFVVSSVLKTTVSAITVTSATGAGTDISGVGATAFMDADTGHGTVTNVVISQVVLTTSGDDPDVDLAIRALGGGVVKLEDTAQMASAAAPTANAQIANKKYVDDSVAAVSSSSPISLTAGETIDGTPTPRPVAIGGTSVRKALRVSTPTWSTGSGATNQNVGDVDAKTWLAQSFTITDAFATTISLSNISIMIGKFGAPAGNVYMEIQTDAAGVPSGTVITNGTSGNFVANTGTDAKFKVQTFTFATPPTLTSGTQYWFVIKRSVANDAANYVRVKRTIGTNIIAGGYSTYTASSTTWAAASTDDLFYDMIYTVNYSGRAFNADADNLSFTRVAGFATTDATAGNAVTVLSFGVVSGLAALTPGSAYYLSTTAGGVTAAPTGAAGTTVTPLGTAMSATTINFCPRQLTGGGIAFARNDSVELTDSDGFDFSYFIETGFHPEYINLSCEILESANNATGGYMNSITGTNLNGISFYDLNGLSFVTAQTTLITGASVASIFVDANNYVTVGTIYDNGFDLRIVGSNSSMNPRNIYWNARGH